MLDLIIAGGFNNDIYALNSLATIGGGGNNRIHDDSDDSTIAGGSGERMPSENELEAARFQGQHVATIATKLSA